MQKPALDVNGTVMYIKVHPKEIEMKTATRQMTWTTSKGNATATITVTRGIETTTRKTGWDVEISEEFVICETNVSVIVSGVGVITGKPCRDPRLPVGYVAVIGGYGSPQLGLSEIVYTEMTALIENATVEAETAQSWIDHIIKQNKAADTAAEYQKHYNAVARAMAE